MYFRSRSPATLVILSASIAARFGLGPLLSPSCSCLFVTHDLLTAAPVILSLHPIWRSFKSHCCIRISRRCSHKSRCYSRRFRCCSSYFRCCRSRRSLSTSPHSAAVAGALAGPSSLHKFLSRRAGRSPCTDPESASVAAAPRTPAIPPTLL